jgi:hypothetical protein
MEDSVCEGEIGFCIVHVAIPRLELGRLTFLVVGFAASTHPTSDSKRRSTQALDMSKRNIE